MEALGLLCVLLAAEDRVAFSQEMARVPPAEVCYQQHLNAVYLAGILDKMLTNAVPGPTKNRLWTDFMEADRCWKIWWRLEMLHNFERSHYSQVDWYKEALQFATPYERVTGMWPTVACWRYLSLPPPLPGND